MTRRTPVPDEALAILACDIGVRPAGAPTPDDLAPAVRGMRREAGTLAIEFEPTVADLVAAFAAAEQVCCSGIEWTVEHGTTVILRVRAAPGQLDTLARFWPQESGR
jgi:hypothetical protein